MEMKTINKENELISLSYKQMEQLRKELRGLISKDELGPAWQSEALDRIFTVSQMNPAAFHRIWIQPLLAVGPEPRSGHHSHRRFLFSTKLIARGQSPSLMMRC